MRKAWVRKVDPVGLHGFKQGELTLDGLEPGLNLVIARNATGKSTLAKAIGLLFDPAKCERDHLILGVIDGWDGERHVQAKRKSERYPGFPGEFDQYQLDLLKLIEGFKGHTPLDAEIADGMRFTAAPAVGMQRLGEVTEAKEARQRLVDARREKKAVADVEDRMPRLEQRVEEAQSAERLARTVEALERRRTSEASVARLKAEVETTAAKWPGIALQREDATAVAKTLLENLKKALARYSEATRKLKSVRSDGERPKSALDMAGRAMLDRLVAELSRLEADILAAERHVREEIAKAATARNQALRLVTDGEDGAFPLVKSEDFESLIAAASQADATRLARLQAEGFQAMLDDWRKNRSAPDPELERKLQRLIAWLAFEPASQIIDRRLPAMALILALFAIGEAFLATLPLRLAIAAGAICLSAPIYFYRTSEAADRPEIGDLIDAPNPAKVVLLLESLARHKACQEIENELDAKAKIVAPAFDWASVSAELRVRCQNPYALAPLSTSLSAYHQASVIGAEARERLELLRESAEEKRGRLRDIYTSHGFPVAEGEELTATEALKAWFESDENLERTQSDVLDSERALNGFLKENGVTGIADPEEALAELARRASAAKEFHNSLREIENLEAATARETVDSDLLQSAIEGHPLEMADLEAIRRRWEAVAAELPHRRQELSDARSKVQAAERAVIPEREHAYEAALSKVEVRFEQLVRQAVRARIGKEIQERLRTTELPDVVRRASGHLETFTEGRFRLEIGADRSEGLGMLVVRDKSREVQDFSQLSTGTKVHAVIAIRLAIIKSQEDKVEQRTGAITRFPLIADEALAVSDPECSQEIAHTLASIAQDRQVIVFTNHPQDEALFRRYDKHLNVRTLGATPVETPALPVRRSRKPEIAALPDVPQVQLGLDI